jgi:hypothetical protein
MAYIYKKLNLQLFGGEGAAGDGGAGAAATGDGGAQAAAAPDAGENRLRELGVPEHVLNKRANRKSARKQSAVSAQTDTNAPKRTEEMQDAAAQARTEQNNSAAAARMSWDEIMADPEYNAEMQKTMQKRLKSAKGAEESLSKLGPAIELLANKYGMDMNSMDYDALAQAITNDDSYYEEKALERGKTIEETKQEVLQEQAQARQQRTFEQKMLSDHFDSLVRQGEELKKIFPHFDLQKELEHPAFRRMTAPGVGISVEDAYHAVHRKEIDAARNQLVAQQVSRGLSNSIQSGQMRPVENGTSAKAASVTSFDYRTASKAEREALKRDIYSGRKIYPGQR